VRHFTGTGYSNLIDLCPSPVTSAKPSCVKSDDTGLNYTTLELSSEYSHKATNNNNNPSTVSSVRSSGSTGDPWSACIKNSTTSPGGVYNVRRASVTNSMGCYDGSSPMSHRQHFAKTDAVAEYDSRNSINNYRSMHVTSTKSMMNYVKIDCARTKALQQTAVQYRKSLLGESVGLGHRRAESIGTAQQYSNSIGQTCSSTGVPVRRFMHTKIGRPTR